MNTSQNDRLETESMIHSLLSNELDEKAIRRLCRRIVDESETREVLRNMLEFQESCRASLGHASAGDEIGTSLPRLKSALSAAERKPNGFSVLTHSLFGIGAVNRLLRIAAVLAIGVSLYLAVTASLDNSSLQSKIALIEKAAQKPDMMPTKAEIANYVLAYSQVADDSNPWVLVKSRENDLVGDIIPNSGERYSTGQVLLVRCLITDKNGKCVYSADVLTPHDQGLLVKSLDAGQFDNRRVHLTIETHEDLAMIGINLDDRYPYGASINGHTNIGSLCKELGSMNINGQDLKVYVGTQKLDLPRKAEHIAS